MMGDIWTCTSCSPQINFQRELGLIWHIINYHVQPQLITEAREIFIPVKGAEGYYEVSNTGKVRSVSGGRRKGVELKQSTLPRGYKRVSLVKDGDKTNASIHRLVAEAFLSNPENKPCVNHIDGNPANNRLENLEWCTYSENELHSHHVLGKIPHNKDSAEMVTNLCRNCRKEVTSRLWTNKIFCNRSCSNKYRWSIQEPGQPQLTQSKKGK